MHLKPKTYLLPVSGYVFLSGGSGRFLFIFHTYPGERCLQEQRSLRPAAVWKDFQVKKQGSRRRGSEEDDRPKGSRMVCDRLSAAGPKEDPPAANNHPKDPVPRSSQNVSYCLYNGPSDVHQPWMARPSTPAGSGWTDRKEMGDSLWHRNKQRI